MYSTNELRMLRRDARRSDEALNEMIELNKRYAKIANSRLLRLERKGYDYYAYDRASEFNREKGRRRFSTTLDNPIDLYEQMLELRAFLNARSSTITGQKAIIKERKEAFSEMGIDIPRGEEKDFLRFLGNQDVREMIDLVGSSRLGGLSGELVEAIAGAWKGGLNQKKILNLFEQYKGDEIGYNDIYDYLRSAT